MNLKLRTFQGVLILALVTLFVFLGCKEFAPRGVLTMSKSVSETSPFLSRVLPDTRVEDVYTDARGMDLQSIVGEPAYFTLTPPRDFDAIDFEILFKNETAPVVELGVLTNVDADAYQLKPLQNKILDELDWDVVQEGDVTLYDRHGKYDLIADFLVDTPRLEEIAAYHYQLDRPYRIPYYIPNSQTRTLELSLRGEHEFLTYIENETLNFTFDVMDMNRTIGEDSVTVLVFDKDSEVVASATLDDDGDVSQDGVGSEMRSISINSSLPNGVYKFVFKTNRDIFIRRITTTQQKLTFTNHLFLGDEVGYWPEPRATSFMTEAKNLSLETQHAEGVQTVTIARAPVSVDEPFVQTRHSVRAPGLSYAHVPKGDLLIRGAGHYAFTPGMYFNPDPVRLGWDTDLDALGINYVITTYKEPVVEDDVVRAQASFELIGVPQVRDAWKFVFSLPGIYDYQGSIELSDIKVRLNREPLTLDYLTGKAISKLRDIF